jgi:hypothetical protein
MELWRRWRSVISDSADSNRRCADHPGAGTGDSGASTYAGTHADTHARAHDQHRVRDHRGIGRQFGVLAESRQGERR